MMKGRQVGGGGSLFFCTGCSSLSLPPRWMSHGRPPALNHGRYRQRMSGRRVRGPRWAGRGGGMGGGGREDEPAPNAGRARRRRRAATRGGEGVGGGVGGRAPPTATPLC